MRASKGSVCRPRYVALVIETPESKKHYVYLTNLFHLSAQEIAAIYKARWQIELFSNGSSST